jgi:hypothetical protein
VLDCETAKQPLISNDKLSLYGFVFKGMKFYIYSSDENVRNHPLRQAISKQGGVILEDFIESK